MIFIYGSKPVILHHVTPLTTNCKFCESTGTTTIISHSSHAHLYYIPMFPTGIKITSTCSECNFELKEKEFPPEYASHTEIVRNNSKTPVWQFSGVILIVIAIIYGIISSQLKSDREADYLATPIAGDIYQNKIGYNRYSTMKVISVFEDSIFYNHNLMEADRSNMFDELNVAENYISDEVFYMLQKDLDSLNTVGAVLDVIRETD